jgi:hypothetical protein
VELVAAEALPAPAIAATPQDAASTPTAVAADRIRRMQFPFMIRDYVPLVPRAR